MRQQKLNKRGFTIIELLVSTAIFSTVLLMCCTVMIYIGRTYYKGVTTAKTQTVARTVLDDISRPLQFSSETPTATDQAPGSNHVFCIGNKRYTYIIDRQLSATPVTANNQSKHVLWVDTKINSSTTTCTVLDLSLATPTDPNSLGDGREILSDSMRLTKFNVAAVGSSTTLYKVDIWVVYGDEDVLNPPDGSGSRNCNDGQVGSQFCALAELSTVVQRRLQ